MRLFKRKPKYNNETMSHGAKLITVANPKDPVSEQFRTIRTNIQFVSVDRDLKLVAFTSSRISEGKSTVTANVAITWAQSGKRVLLIDADLRRSTLHSTFQLDNRTGLTTILTSKQATMNVTDFIHDSGVKNLSVLTAGPTPPNPSELLNSQRMQDFLSGIKDQYDLVVLDVPPMLEVTDTQVLASQLDGVILVVRAGKTQKSEIRRAVDMLRLAKANILGYVFNDADGTDSAYGYGYGYGYGYEADGK